MTVLSYVLKILTVLSLLLGLAQVTAGFLKVELFKLPALYLKLIGAGLLVLAGVLGTADHLSSRRMRPTPPPRGGNVVSGAVTSGGDVSITQQIIDKLEVHQGDSEQQKAQKRSQAQRIVAESILVGLRHIDQRLLALDTLSEPDKVKQELDAIRKRVAPALQETGREILRSAAPPCWPMPMTGTNGLRSAQVEAGRRGLPEISPHAAPESATLCRSPWFLRRETGCLSAEETIPTQSKEKPWPKVPSPSPISSRPSLTSLTASSRAKP